MIRVIQPGETGVDFAYSKPPPARLVELGYSFVVGYCSSNQSKNLLNPLDYVNAGLGVAYVFELSAARPNGGRAVGLIDGAFAKAWLQGCGYPVEAPVIFAFDTNTNSANIAAHIAYFNAAAEACAPFSVGGYLDTDLAAAVDEAVGWLPLAWSWSGSSKFNAEAKARELGYHVLQGKGFWIDNQWAVDPNTAIRPFSTWGFPKSSPAPVVEEDDMAAITFEVSGLPGIYLWAPGMTAPVPFPDPNDLALVEAASGAKRTTAPLSSEMFNRLHEPSVTVNVPPIVVPAIPAAQVHVTVSQV